MPFGADVVPEECRTMARRRRRAASRSAGRSLGRPASSTCSGATLEQQRHLARPPRGTSRSPSRRRRRRSPVALRLGERVPRAASALNIGGSGASTTPRCRQPSIATAASIEWRPSRITTSPGSTPRPRAGARPRRAARLQLRRSVTSRSSRISATRSGCSSARAVEVLPQVARAPVALARSSARPPAGTPASSWSSVLSSALRYK